MVELKTSLIGQNGRMLHLKNPILTASGTYGYCNEFDDFIDVSCLGGIVTKAISLKPKKGNEGDRIFETIGGMINRIGLENIGIEEFILKKIPILKEKNINFIMNLAGSSLEEYIETAKLAQNADIKAIELNVSCPNVKEGCLEFGILPETLSRLVSSVRKVFQGFLIVKLTPNTSDIEALALAAQNSGADCISAINTVKGLGIKIEILPNGNITKKEVQGGLSGRCIKPVALSMVKRIKSAVKIPIIGIGGISSTKDVLEFFSVGAEAVQIGTENFTHPDITEKIINGLRETCALLKVNNISELKEKLR